MLTGSRSTLWLGGTSGTADDDTLALKGSR
jgi:hypothetical protein